MAALVPTKADFEAFVFRIESSYTQAIAEVKEEVTNIGSKVVAVEKSHDDLAQRVAKLEQSQSQQDAYLSDLLLRIDDQDNRGRRNNIRVRGIPESTAPVDLHATVRDVFNMYLGRPPDAVLELDRAHRSLGPRPPDQQKPRDVICRVHKYLLKEEIMRLAWRKGPLDFDGATIQLLPDVSRHTLWMRRLLRPLLDVIRNAGATYKWGYPFHVIIKKAERTFLLKSPRDLPDLFAFLEAEPIPVPDWLHISQVSMPTGIHRSEGRHPPRSQTRPRRLDRNRRDPYQEHRGHGSIPRRPAHNEP